MKIKRNTITALILGCVLSANIAIANTVDQSEISGTWTSDTATSGTVTAFSESNLGYTVTTTTDSTDSDGDTTTSTSTSTEYITFPLGDVSTDTRFIDYDVVYKTDDDGVMTAYIVNSETGEEQEFWGFREDVTIDVDDSTTPPTVTYTYGSTSITRDQYAAYFFDEEEEFLNIEGGIVDLNLTATATDGDDAIALDTSAMLDSDGNVVGMTDEYTVNSDSLEGYDEDQVVTILGYMKINATASSVGGSATAVYGDITHSYLTVNGTNGTVYSKQANGDLTMTLNATATASYDESTSTWSGGTATGMKGNLDSQVGNSTVTINATSYGSTATGFEGFTIVDDADDSDDTTTDDTVADDTTTDDSGYISIGAGNVSISAYTFDRTVNATDGSTVTSTAGDATAINGTATFAGTTVSLVAYSESAAATGATDITVTDGGNLTISATGVTSAIGATSATITDSTIKSIVATSSEGSAIGVSTLTATDSDATISASGDTSATAVTTATLTGDTSLTATATSNGTAIGVDTLDIYVPTELTDTDDIDLKISAYSTTEAIGINTLDTVSSTNVDFDVTAQASGTSATTATAINDDVTLSSNVSSFAGNISATATSTEDNATATAIEGAIGTSGQDLDIKANITASASTTGDTGDATATALSGDAYGDIYGTISAYAKSENGTATATAIDGNVEGDIFGNIEVIAIGSTAEGIIGNISGDISGNVSVSAYSTTDGDIASATAIDGDISGDISGNISATADSDVSGDTATAEATAIAISGTIDGTISGNITASADATAATATATATAIQTDGTSLTFDNATISATATATGDTATATATAIDASGNLTTYGDATIYGDIDVTGTLTLGDATTSSTLTQQGGSLTATSVNVSNESSNYSMSFDVNGDLPVFANGTSIDYSYATTSELQASAASGLISASAATLVGDNATISNGSIEFGGTDISTLVTAEGGSYDVEGNGIDYTFTSTGTDTTVTVTGTTYFEDKANTSNAATLGAVLDAIEITADDDDNLALRTMKETVDSLNVDSFVPYANSFVSQVNAETYSNISLASVWRMRALMDKRVKTKRELAAEAIRNNPAFDGVDPDPTFKLEAKRVAQFQSVNMMASRDGGSAAPDYDYVSTGGTADIDFSINNNLLLGVGVGGVYNKIDGSNGSGDAESTSFILNMYAMYNLGDLDLFATLGYAHGFNESSKSSSIGNEEADWDSDSIFHLAGLSYSIDFKNGLILRPMAMYNLVYQKVGESTTTGGTYSTTVSGESYLNFKTYIGGEIIYTITKELELVARAFWTHEFGDNSYDYNYTSSLFSQYVGSIAYNGEAAERDAFLIGLGLGYKFNEGIALYLDYNANISSDFLGHNLNAALQMKF